MAQGSDHSIGIRLLVAQALNDFALLFVGILSQSFIIHRRNLNHCIIGIPGTVYCFTTFATDYQGQSSGCRYTQPKHGFAGQEVVDTGSKHSPSVGSSSKRCSPPSLQLEFIAIKLGTAYRKSISIAVPCTVGTIVVVLVAHDAKSVESGLCFA